MMRLAARLLCLTRKRCTSRVPLISGLCHILWVNHSMLHSHTCPFRVCSALWRRCARPYSSTLTMFERDSSQLMYRVRSHARICFPSAGLSGAGAAGAARRRGHGSAARCERLQQRRRAKWQRGGQPRRPRPLFRARSDGHRWWDPLLCAPCRSRGSSSMWCQKLGQLMCSCCAGR